MADSILRGGHLVKSQWEQWVLRSSMLTEPSYIWSRLQFFFSVGSGLLVCSFSCLLPILPAFFRIEDLHWAPGEDDSLPAMAGIPCCYSFRCSPLTCTPSPGSGHLVLALRANQYEWDGMSSHILSLLNLFRSLQFLPLKCNKCPQ